MRIYGPSFPLTREQFANALAKGLGRARMHVERHGATGLEDVILDACLHSKAYDVQVEGDRPDWTHAMLVSTGIEAKVIGPLADELAKQTPSRFSRDAYHQLRIAGLLARRGFVSARDALYLVCGRATTLEEMQCGDEVQATDGQAGLVWLARKAGDILRQPADPTFWGDPSWGYDDLHGEGSGLALLKSLADSDLAIRRYVDHLDEVASGKAECKPQKREQRRNRWSTVASPAPLPNVDTVIAEIESTVYSPGFWLRYRRWGREASPGELAQVVDRIRTCENPDALMQYLGIIHSLDFPELIPRVMELARGEHERLRWAAVRVLAEYSDSRVRDFAVECLAARRLDSGELRLFTKNSRPCDAVRIENALYVPDDRDNLHRICSDVLDVFCDNLIAEARNCLLFAYQSTPCSQCRRLSVRTLLFAKAAPDWLLEECRYDSDEETRKLVENRPA